MIIQLCKEALRWIRISRCIGWRGRVCILESGSISNWPKFASLPSICRLFFFLHCLSFLLLIRNAQSLVPLIDDNSVESHPICNLIDVIPLPLDPHDFDHRSNHVVHYPDPFFFLFIFIPLVCMGRGMGFLVE